MHLPVQRGTCLSPEGGSPALSDHQVHTLQCSQACIRGATAMTFVPGRLAVKLPHRLAMRPGEAGIKVIAVRGEPVARNAALANPRTGVLMLKFDRGSGPVDALPKPPAAGQSVPVSSEGELPQWGDLLRGASLGSGGGGGEIRTHGTLAGTTVFETVAIDHSATPPRSQENPQGVFLGARRLVEALCGRNPWPGAGKPISPYIRRRRMRPLSMVHGRKATRC